MELCSAPSGNQEWHRLSHNVCRPDSEYDPLSWLYDLLINISEFDVIPRNRSI